MRCRNGRTSSVAPALTISSMTDPYELKRPSSAAGVGPLTVFRAISRDKQPLLQAPRAWVTSLPAFHALSEASNPEIAAPALVTSQVPAVAKIWTELAYEEVRKSVAPGSPSRLTSLFAFADPLEAFAFTEETGEAKTVYEGGVLDGVSWAVTDMSRFRMVEPQENSPAGFAQAWQEASVDAAAYWMPSGDFQMAEVLVEGGIQLIRQLTLIPFLRDIGIVI